MMQKSSLFKGQQKKSAPANRHGKQPHIRKGKQFKTPSKKGKEWEVDKVRKELVTELCIFHAIGFPWKLQSLLMLRTS
ncbi:hypothetical protein R1flu_008348 [Riccia fluitans]|uniref:Uncharacterized protein n=1 Tax=Riccia fluitans TaxID=41844 RepID=A0ABD1YBF6_9MARC